jgi:hypothetical protein
LRRKNESRSELENIEAGGYLILMTLADGDLITKQVDGIATNVVDLRDVYYIGPMHFEEVGADELFLHVLKRAIGDIVLSLGDELDIIAHAFEEEDIVLLELDQFILSLYKEKVGVGRRRDSGCNRNGWGSGGGGLLAELFDGFLEALVRERLFQIVVDMVLKGVECVFGLGGSENDPGRISETIQQIEAGSAGHFDIEEEQIDLLPVEKLQGIRYVQEMPFHLDQFALLTELTKKIRGYLDIFYYNTRQFHPELTSFQL